MRQITAVRGQTILVSNEDYERASTYSWHVDRGGYARRSTTLQGRQYTQPMHRFLMGMVRGDKREVDHINGNKLDNRRENLRICTRSENQWNRSTYACNKTGFKGVDRHSGKFRARIRQFGELIHLGLFETAEAAHEAYKAAANRLHGEFARHL